MSMRPGFQHATEHRHGRALPSPVVRHSRALRDRSTTVTGFLRAMLLLTSVACVSALRSTEGGRREARRQCLAAARAAGWKVMDIGPAQFKGSARYEVSLVVEMDTVPRQTLTCAYDLRTSVSDLRKTGS